MAFNQQFFRNMPPVTKNLIMINLFIYLIQALVPSSKEAVMMQYLSLHYFSSPDFNPAQLLTYMFMHGSFMHVFFNMFTLWMFGTQIEYSLGSRRFLFFYLSCGIGAGLVQEGVYAIMLAKYNAMFTPDQMHEIIVQGNNALRRGMNFTDPTMANINVLVNGTAVGASGAIYGILLAYGMLYPDNRIMLLIPPIPIKAKYMVMGWVLIELVLGISNRPGDNIAHFCHLGGMLIGFLIILYWKKKGTFNGFNGFY